MWRLNLSLAGRQYSTMRLRVPPKADDGLPYGWMLLDGTASISRVRAIPTDLDLSITAPKRLDVAIRQVTGQVPSLVEPCAWCVTCGMNHSAVSLAVGDLSKACPTDV